ncbi:DUF1778 domain-containing protein [Sphingomonas sp. AOB5]|uniref:type II toxin-antitoxin system TacA family antitoxin n=1 Tax=Sphingomonas sp. AOB5 TaxID=3034017 RepID=UPI0023F6DA74|nr:DUF1778 domain-containing protein [Sphingomonas sp. AOB5]MDF7776297.1 DUF1778 domain-containing protein [Sphingomonas sp. AOB5]
MNKNRDIPESAPKRTVSDQTINLRVSSQMRDLIDRAAAASGKTRTEFVLESARSRAINFFLDEVVFNLNEEQTVELDSLLDNPPRPVQALRTLMVAKTPWK